MITNKFEINLMKNFISALLLGLPSVAFSDPIQAGHYALYRQMEFSNICAIYEVWWPFANEAYATQELDSRFVTLMHKELIPKIGQRFGKPGDFADSMHFYMKKRVKAETGDYFEPVDCIAYQYHLAAEIMWDQEKIGKIILDDPDFWFGSAVTQQRLTTALSDEILLCFAASGEWGNSCSPLEKE
jgi:hypothetical protein